MAPPAQCAHFGHEDVGRLWSRLLGRRVVVKRGNPTKVAAAVSSYTNTENVLAAAVAFDLELANFAAAALPMVPSAVATDAIAGRKVDAEMLENLREVANIMASLFTCPAAHIKLRELARTPPAPPGDLLPILVRPARRLDLDIDVTGYSAGRLAVFFGAPPITG